MFIENSAHISPLFILYTLRIKLLFSIYSQSDSLFLIPALQMTNLYLFSLMGISFRSLSVLLFVNIWERYWEFHPPSKFLISQVAFLILSPWHLSFYWILFFDVIKFTEIQQLIYSADCDCPATESAIIRMLRYSLAHADRHFPQRSKVMDKVCIISPNL